MEAGKQAGKIAVGVGLEKKRGMGVGRKRGTENDSDRQHQCECHVGAEGPQGNLPCGPPGRGLGREARILGPRLSDRVWTQLGCSPSDPHDEQAWRGKMPKWRGSACSGQTFTRVVVSNGIS